MDGTIPASNRFVARAAGVSRSALTDRLRAVGTVEPFEEDDRAVIVSVPAVSEVQGEARAVWLRLREIFGDTVQFSPVLLDESAAPMVPTGQVTVLFREPTTPANVQRFAADHGLTLAPTRSWSPQQARFLLGAVPRFLPDVVEELRADPRALDAWPEVWLDVAFEGLSAR